MHDPTAFERFLFGLADRLTALPTWDLDDAITDVLRDIGEALGTDRTVLVEFGGPGSVPSALTAEVTRVWVRPGLNVAVPTEPLSAELPWYRAAITGSEVLALAHVERDLPAGAERERDFARAAGLKSHLVVPIAVDGRLVCAVSTSTFGHYCAWSGHLIDRLRLVGQIVALAISRARPVGAAPGQPWSRGSVPIRRLDEVERDHILQVIDRCGGRINGRGHAAETLGLHPNTLRSRMKKLGILRRNRRVKRTS